MGSALVFWAVNANRYIGLGIAGCTAAPAAHPRGPANASGAAVSWSAATDCTAVVVLVFILLSS